MAGASAVVVGLFAGPQLAGAGATLTTVPPVAGNQTAILPAAPAAQGGAVAPRAATAAAPCTGSCPAPVQAAAAASPVLTTTASPQVALINNTLRDDAILVGGNAPTGTVTFRLFSDASCTVQVFTSTDTVFPGLLGAGQATSEPFNAPGAGLYHWQAVYSGDANNNPTGPTLCLDPLEQVLVGKNSPVLATTAQPRTATVGTELRDTAALSVAFLPTGTVTFRLFSDPGCTVQVFTTSAPVDPLLSTATSSPFVVTTAGTYHWVASYSGDLNNNPADAAACDNLNEQVVVTGSSSTTSTSSTSTSSTSTSSTSTSSTSTSSTSTSSTSTSSSTSTTSSTVPTGTSSSSSSSTSSTSSTVPSTSTTAPATTIPGATTSSSLPAGSSTTQAPSSTTSAPPTSSSTSSSTSTSLPTTIPTGTTSSVPASTSSTTTTRPSTTTTAAPTTTSTPSTTAPLSTSTSTVTTVATSTTSTTRAPTSTTTSTTTASTSTTAPITTVAPFAGPATTAAPTLTASPQTVSPGGTTTVTGSGFPAGSPALVQLFSDPVTLGTATVDATGRFRIVVTIPLVTPPGVHTLVATGPGGSARAQAPLTVTAPAGVLGVVSQVVRPLLAPALLARTGSATDEVGRLALLLMLAGALLVVAEASASPSRTGPFPFRRRRTRWPRRR